MTDEFAAEDVQRFIEEGFVCIRGAFSRSVADAGRELLWEETGLDRDDPSSWREPVVRIMGSAAAPFAEAARSQHLGDAFDALVGKERWLPRDGLGTFPIRFPNERKPDDTGWHCDGSFGDYPFRLNVRSKGRALLMLFLFSDIGENDAPTRIRVGSHLDIPALLAPYGEDGLTFIELAERSHVTERRDVALATGEAGDVYLCHPFLVHAAQSLRSQTPRFIAQPPLQPREPISIKRRGPDPDYSPVEKAIRLGLGL